MRGGFVGVGVVIGRVDLKLLRDPVAQGFDRNADVAGAGGTEAHVREAIRSGLTEALTALKRETRQVSRN